MDEIRPYFETIANHGWFISRGSTPVFLVWCLRGFRPNPSACPNFLPGSGSRSRRRGRGGFLATTGLGSAVGALGCFFQKLWGFHAFSLLVFSNYITFLAALGEFPLRGCSNGRNGQCCKPTSKGATPLFRSLSLEFRQFFSSSRC